MARRFLGSTGYSLVELVIVVAVILIVAAYATPQFLSYYQTAKVRAAAQTVSAVLNEARQLAIKNNLNRVAVCITTTTMQFRQPDCSGSLLSAPGLTGASNFIALPEGVVLAASGGSAIFSNLGAATTGITYTVSDTASSRTMSVVVATSGRIRLGP